MVFFLFVFFTFPLENGLSKKRAEAGGRTGNAGQHGGNGSKGIRTFSYECTVNSVLCNFKGILSHDHESSNDNGGLCSLVSTQTLKSIPDVVQNYNELRKLQDYIS